MLKNATISPCQKHRYELSRIWDTTKPKVLFIMLNPSTADSIDDDPTIRRCINFAKLWGYGGLLVGNLFSYRSKNPKDLRPFSHEIDYYHNDQNHQHILKMYWQCELVICAWGNPPFAVSHYPLQGYKRHFLKLTKSGQPCHPLYLRGDLMPSLVEYSKHNF